MISRLTNNVLSVYDVSAQELKFDSDDGTAIDQLSITNDDITNAIKNLNIRYHFGDEGEYTSIQHDNNNGWVLPTKQICIENASPSYDDIFDSNSQIEGSWAEGFTTNFTDDANDHRTGRAAPPYTQSSASALEQWASGSYAETAFSTTTSFTQKLAFRTKNDHHNHVGYVYAMQYSNAMYGSITKVQAFSGDSNFASSTTAWNHGDQLSCLCYFDATTETIGAGYIRSDRRIKKNFVPIENAMKSIDKINIVKYDKYVSFDKKGAPTKDVGVIAQEIMSANDPNLLKSVCIIYDETEKYLINYDILFCLAIKAFQELHDEYEKFKEEKNKKLLHLMERITALENKKY